MYREVILDGITTLEIKSQLCTRRTKLCVRYMHDEHGESLSIADEAAGIMLHIPFNEADRKNIGINERR